MERNAKKENSYEDMLYLAHPVSKTHPQMSLHDRAAQFSPFAALTGFEGAIKETARITDQKIELDETQKAVLDEKLQRIQDNLEERPRIELNYFVYDERKAGGTYEKLVGEVRLIDPYKKMIRMWDGQEVFINDIRDIKGVETDLEEDYIP